MLMWFSDASGSTPAVLTPPTPTPTPPPQLAAAIVVLLTILSALCSLPLVDRGSTLQSRVEGDLAFVGVVDPDQGAGGGGGEDEDEARAESGAAGAGAAGARAAG
jgi:hypothetical protein